MATKYLVSFPGSLAPECEYTGSENLKSSRAETGKRNWQKKLAKETGNLVHEDTDFKFSQTANLKPL